MNNSHIVIGYPDHRHGVGTGKPILVAGTDVSANDQVKLINAVRGGKPFPKGCRYIALVALNPRGLCAIAAPQSVTGSK